MKNFTLLLSICALVASLSFSSCRENKTTGEKVEEAAEKAGDDIENYADEVGDAVEDASDEVENAID